MYQVKYYVYQNVLINYSIFLILFLFRSYIIIYRAGILVAQNIQMTSKHQKGYYKNNFKYFYKSLRNKKKIIKSEFFVFLNSILTYN